MKRFLIIGVMAAAFSTHSNACVSEYSDHNYYMFSVFNRDQTSPAYLYDIASVADGANLLRRSDNCAIILFYC